MAEMPTCKKMTGKSVCKMKSDPFEVANKITHPKYSRVRNRRRAGNKCRAWNKQRESKF